MKPVSYDITKTRNGMVFPTSSIDPINESVVHPFIDRATWEMLGANWYWREARNIQKEVEDEYYDNL